jgi:trimeric autotransporter adhesin
MYSRRWLIGALVVAGLAGGCSQFNTNLTTQTSTSVLTFLSPSSVGVGSVPSTGLLITANGAGFVSGAIILWNLGPNQVQLTTTFVNSSQVTATVPAADFTSAGTVAVAVQIPGSAVSGSSGTTATTTTEVSNLVNFTIGPQPPPPPTITSTSISPSSTPIASIPYCGASGFTLVVNGTNFVAASVVNWNGTPHAITFVSATQITAVITPMETAFLGAAVITVSNPTATSPPVTFTMTTPTANLAAPSSPSLQQTQAAAGSPAFTLRVDGTSILPCTVVQWQASSSSAITTLATSYVPATQTAPAYLNAIVPAADLLAVSSPQVFLFTLGPAGSLTTPGCVLVGCISAGATFTISPPTVTSVTASSTSYCNPAGFTLTVNGTNFVSGSVVNWNGMPRPTTFVSAMQLTAAIPPTDTVLPGTAAISVSNLPSAVNSNSMNFSATVPSSLPAPTITSLSPAQATAGTAAFPLTVTGTNFVPCSGVQWKDASGNITSLAPTSLSATHLIVTIPVANIASVGTAQVSVFTPAPGGGASGGIAFPIVAPTISSLVPSSTPYCGTTGFPLTVNGTNFVDGLVVNWNGSPRPTTFISPTQLSAIISPADTAFPGVTGTAAVTVSSSTTPSASSNFTLTVPSSLPVPTITSLMPNSAAVGTTHPPTGAFFLTAIGSSLVPCSAVQWTDNGGTTTAPTTMYVDPTGVRATIPDAYVANVGTAQVKVTTPAPAGCTPGVGVTCGGTSGALPFLIYPLAAAARRATVGQIADAISASADSLSLPVMSSDNRYAVFVLASSDGLTETPGSIQNVFVRDTCAGAAAGCTPSTSIVSLGFNSNPADGDSISPSISADGRYVTFVSSAANLVDSDTNGVIDVFVRDTCAGAASGCAPSTQRVSVATDGTQGDGASTSGTISATGRYVTFRSAATNLDPASPPNSSGIFLRDTCAGAPSGCTPSTQQVKP